MTLKQIKAELRLFKAYTDDTALVTGVVNEDALKSGLLITGACSDDIVTQAVELYGIKPTEWNQTFHKSFQTVIDTPIEVLIAQQLMHYFTTYGLESLGLYNEDLVYIPHEQLDIPELTEDIKLIPINYITELELKDRLYKLLTSGIALSKQTIEDIMTLSDYIDRDKFDDVNNKEVKIALYEKYGVVPKNNMEFLRYLIYKLTGSTLMIKSKELLSALDSCDKDKALRMLKAYVSTPTGYRKLGEIYLTQVKYFIAMKSHSSSKTKVEKELNHIINRIRKEAKHSHKSNNVNVLDRLTSIYKADELNKIFYYNTYVKKSQYMSSLTQSEITVDNLIELLDGVTVFREIRILNAIRYRRLGKSSAIMYKVRNGKAYLDDIDINVDAEKTLAQTMLYNIIEDHLISRLGKYLRGKSIYIPTNVTYMAPTSEKQFLGNLPLGTTITIPRDKNMVVGVHWKNLNNERVDLDLHATSREGHFGWNGLYRDESNIVFSGDVTDAKLPNGATECFLIKKDAKDSSFVMKLKNFTANKFDVPYEFIVASISDVGICSNYVINPNNVITSINTKFEYDVKQNTRPDRDIAMVTVSKDEIKIIFNNFSTDTTISKYDKEVMEKLITYNESYAKVQLSLNDILVKVDCDILDKPYTEEMQEVIVKTENGEETLYRKVEKRADLDLSVENISKDTLIKLFTEA